MHLLVVTPQRLLALNQADLFQLLPTKLDADILTDAIAELRTGERVRSAIAQSTWCLQGSAGSSWVRGCIRVRSRTADARQATAKRLQIGTISARSAQH